MARIWSEGEGRDEEGPIERKKLSSFFKPLLQEKEVGLDSATNWNLSKYKLERKIYLNYQGNFVFFQVLPF